MLTLLTGINAAAKKKHITQLLLQKTQESKQVFLVVPEQSSFERGRQLLEDVGESAANLINVTSFTRFAREALDKYALSGKPETDEAARLVIMSLAVQEVSDGLEIFRRYSTKQPLVAQLTAQYDEFMQAGITPAQLYETAKRLPHSTLRSKSRELAEIFSAYDALITERFSEASDNINKLTRFLCGKHEFGDSVFFFDDFRGFTGAQTAFLAALLPQTAEAYISFTIENLSVQPQADGAFAHSAENCKRIRDLAKKAAVAIKEYNTDIPDEQNTRGEAIRYFAENIWRDSDASIKGEDGAITVCRAKDKYDECDFVALKIRELLEKGFRCREIAVVERGNSYARPLAAALKKYSIPVFEDKRRALREYPLIRMVLSSSEIAAFGFSTERVMRYLKTGITQIDENTAAALENYVYLWSIDGREWLSDFTKHPGGFGNQMDEKAEAELKALNDSRKTLITPLEKFRAAVAEKSGSKNVRALYNFIKETNAVEAFRNYAQYLDEHSHTYEALECAAVWDELMRSLDALYSVFETKTVSAKRFVQLLKIMLTSGDLGGIPAGIDEVITGSADRIRLSGIKVLFVTGVNEGVFPADTLPQGLFTVNEKRTLAEGGITLESIPEAAASEEKLIVYTLLSSASQQLYLSYCTGGLGGEKSEPSEIITLAGKLIENCNYIDTSDIPQNEKIGSRATAFEICAANYCDNTVFSQSLREYIRSDDSYGKKILSLERAAAKIPADIADKAVARELFGENMRLYPSRAESFYKCPFMYFCRYGMGIEGRYTAVLDQRINGLLVHHVLEKLLGQYTNAELAAMDEDELRQKSDTEGESYALEYLGGENNMDAPARRALVRAQNTVFEILLRLRHEFGSCSFETRDVELVISETGQIEPYRLALPDGGEMIIGGTVDRVDVMELNGKAYTRVIDYKTGGKDFHLSDVFDGLNMQMLIYLCCLWDNGKKRYGEVVPAGVLYVPANTSGDRLPRRASPDEIVFQKLKNGRMNGVLLEDEAVLKGMESTAAGRYINAYIDKNGQLKGTFLSLSDFRLLHKKIDEKLLEMARLLRSGKIAAEPVISGDYKRTCEFCDYASICRRESDDIYRECLNLKHEEALTELEKSGEATGNE